MQANYLLKKLLYYLFTSGLFLSISLLVLEIISVKFNLVNFFAFSSASFFIINLMQYNVVENNNKNAVYGFLNHTLLGVLTYLFLAISMIILYHYKFNRNQINYIVLTLIVILFIIYFTLYYNGLLDFMN